MSKNKQRLIEVVNEIDSLHSEDPRRGSLYSKITEILCEDKEQTLEMIKTLKEPELFYHISSNFSYIYAKFPDLSLFDEFEKAVENFKNIDFSNSYPYYQWFKQSLEEAIANLAWYEEDKRKEIYYNNLMTIFKNSSEAERYDIIINTMEEGDIQCYLNLSFDDNKDCISPEFDFATAGQAFEILVKKFHRADFSTDTWYLGRIAVLFEKTTYHDIDILREEVKNCIFNSSENDVVLYFGKIKEEEYYKVIIIWQYLKPVLERTQSVKVYEAARLLVGRFESTFLQYYLKKKWQEVEDFFNKSAAGI